MSVCTIRPGFFCSFFLSLLSFSTLPFSFLFSLVWFLSLDGVKGHSLDKHSKMDNDNDDDDDDDDDDDANNNNIIKILFL